MTARKPDLEQRKRFEEAAREAEADETGAAFERAFAAIVPPRRRPSQPKVRIGKKPQK